MKFTLLCYAPSALLIAIAMAREGTNANAFDTAATGFFGVMLLFPATVAVFVYWIVRVIARARHDAGAR